MKFLFVTKEYPPIPSPSGRIVYLLADELKKRGAYVDVITRDEKQHIDTDSNGQVIWIEDSRWSRLSQAVNGANCKFNTKILYFITKYIRKVILAFNINKFPDSESTVTKSVIKLYESELLMNEYDYIIGFFRPYSCLASAMEISKKSRKTKCISCYFDLVELKDRPKFMPEKLYRKKIYDGDRKVFENSYCVMLPRSAEKVRNPLYETYKNKIVFYEFPTFEIKQDKNTAFIEKTIKAESYITKFMFAGTLNKEYRNPIKLLDIINEVAKINKEKKYILDLYGSGDCNEIIETYEAEKNFVIQSHGRVSKDEITKREKEAHVLINIMNSYEAIVPSKIFELFATGKPILNIKTSCDDGSMEYFKKYPLCFTARWSSKEELNEVVDEASLFINRDRNKCVSESDLYEIYKKCTPEYVIDQVMQVIRNDNE